MLTGWSHALMFLGFSVGGVAAVYVSMDVLTYGLAFVGLFLFFLVDVLVLLVRHIWNVYILFARFRF
jgi:hypothetical protein